MEILIIEDEVRSAQKLAKYLQEIDPNLTILHMVQSVRQGVAYLNENKEPDLIFLDIQLSDGESFKIFERITVDSYIIVLTAYDDYAIKAYSLNTVGYILKPFTKSDVAESLKKLQKLRYNRHNIETKENPAKAYQSRFLVQKGYRYVTIKVGDIGCFFKDRSLFIITKSKEQYSYDATLEELELHLDPFSFFRINRQCIINYDDIESIAPESSNRLSVNLKSIKDTQFVVSQGKVTSFKDWLSR